MTLLYVTANPKRVSDSFGLQLGQEFLEAYQKLIPEKKVEILDIMADPPPFLEHDALAMWERHGDMPAEKEALSNPYVEQFLKADTVVLVTPLWNMSFPPQVKAYVDQLIIPEKTFRFSEAGITGLMQNKAFIHIQSRGGEYSHGPLQKFEHGDSYLRTIFGLIGIKDYHHLFVEGTSTYPEEAEDRLKQAKKEARFLAKKLSGQK